MRPNLISPTVFGGADTLVSMLIRTLLAGAGVWSFLFVPAALTLANSPVSQIAALTVGVAPVVLAWRVGLRDARPERKDTVLPDPKDRERELLIALEERGELTPVVAAMRTSLTVDEAAAKLDELARRGHVDAAVRDGVLVYALHGTDRGGRPSPAANGTRADGAARPRGDGAAGDEAAPLVESLSERELEVLTLLVAGRSNKEIARELVVSVGTIKTHTNNIYRKLGVRNRAEAIARARGLHLI
jgi:DNA-binding NarL/FixJ family response regulator